jgi:uncharacterized protein (DUF2164 family)
MIENRASYECFAMLYPAHLHSLDDYLESHQKASVENEEFVAAYWLEWISPELQKDFLQTIK